VVEQELEQDLSLESRPPRFEFALGDEPSRIPKV
jgi:hypothetical protein